MTNIYPDPLLWLFACALHNKPLSPIAVKCILEGGGFYEHNKLKISELAEPLRRFGPGLASLLRKHGFAGSRAEEFPLLQGQSLIHALEALHELLPMLEGPFWRSTIDGGGWIITSFDDRKLATEMAQLFAFERLTRLEHPERNVAYLAGARRRLARLVPRPAHRPSLGEDAVRFRTAAVAAAELRKERGVPPGEARKWVADHLKKGKAIWPGAAKGSAKTIENWSSKGEYDDHLCKGMIALAKALPTGTRTTAQIAKCAVLVAILYGMRTKNY